MRVDANFIVKKAVIAHRQYLKKRCKDGLATAAPKNGAVELAGPEASSLAEIIQSYLASKGDGRKVVPDPDARYFGAVLDKDGLAPVAQFIPGPTRFANWARASWGHRKLGEGEAP